MADPTTLQVTGRFVNVTGDSADASAEPDASPYKKGTVAIVPLLEYGAATGSSPRFGATMGEVLCGFNADGDLIRQGTDGDVKVYDLTDPSLSPHVGAGEYTHRIEFRDIRDTTGNNLGSWSALARIAADTASSGVVDLLADGVMTPLGKNAATPIVYVEGTPGAPGPKGDTGDIGDAVDLGSLTGALDLTAYTLATQTFRLTATGNLTLAPAGMPVIPSGKSGTFTVRITQGSGGSKTLTLDAAIKTAYGVDPVLSSAASAVDVVHFFYTGVEWVALMASPAIA